MENKGKRALAVLLFLCVILVGVAKEASAATLSVTTQPKSATVIVGETASFTVVVSGTGLKYQWQAQAPGTTVWKNSSAASAKTATLKITALAAHNNYKFRCVVTDNSGKTVTSNAATLTVKPMISVQPKSTSTTVGGTATFSITTAISSGVSFQWQAKAPNADSWKNSGATGARTTSMKITAQAAHNGYQFRCVVKDCKGNEYISNAATLTIMPKITAQPKSINVAVGSAAGFSVTVTGKAPLSYQWQSKAPGSDTWKNSVAASAKTNRFSFKVQTAHNGYQFRCVITDGNGRKVTTDAATLNLNLGITAQPQSVMKSESSTVTFHVAAVGKGPLQYQWQSKASDSDTWKNSVSASAKTNQFSFTVQKGHQGYYFRCVVTDGDGNKVITNEVRLTICNVPINSTHFPDGIFRQYISDTFDTTKDGKLSAAEIQAVKRIDVRGKGIVSLKGLEFFVELEWLDCSGDYAVWGEIEGTNDYGIIQEERLNKIESISLTCLTELKYLDCSKNHLTKLDVSKNPKMETLKCVGLVYQGMEGFRDIRIDALDLTSNPMLKYLDCSTNHLTQLNLSQNPLLEQLNCGGFADYGEFNANDISELDFSNNPRLVWLDISGNPITQIDLSGNKDLVEFRCDACSFTELDLHNNIKLEVLSCYSTSGAGINYGEQLRTLNLNGCCRLRELYLGEQGELGALNLSHLENLEVFYQSGNRYCEEDDSFHGLLSLDISGCVKLRKLTCIGNQSLSGIDLSKNTLLEYLDCQNNNLQTLDLGANRQLVYLDCSFNKLRTLNLDANTELAYLDCYVNKLATLNLSANTKLALLNCGYNELEALILSENKQLEYLLCIQNRLTKLDLSKNTQLRRVECGGNSLTELDVSMNTQLTELYCDSNVIVIGYGDQQ